MKRSTAFGLAALLLFTPPIYAANTMIMEATVPSTMGIYSILQLVARPALGASECQFISQIGKFYFNGTTNQFEYCGPSFSWLPITGPWTESANNITLINTNPNAKVGIGVATPEFKLSLDNDGGIMAKGNLGAGVPLTTVGVGTRFMWYPRRAAIRAGHLDATGWFGGNEWNDTIANQNIGDYSVAFGFNTVAQRLGSTVSGGMRNGAIGDFGAVGGGSNNVTGDSIGGTNAVGGTVAGGQTNWALTGWGTIGGGQGNRVLGQHSTIAGGQANTAGHVNIVSFYGQHLFIGGGQTNEISGSFVNEPNFSSIVGGFDNTILDSQNSSIGGGNTNSITIVTGTGGNLFTDHNNVIAGGAFNNILNAHAATVSGGEFNAASGDFSVIGGGGGDIDPFNNFNYGNAANGFASTVSGGQSNKATGDYATIGGGGWYDLVNHINYGNTASGVGSTVSGGQSNTAGGDYSWVGGQYTNLAPTADRTFVWGNGTLASPINVTQSDAFIIATGNVEIGTTMPNPFARVDINKGPYLAAVNINDVLRLAPRNGNPFACGQAAQGALYVENQGVPSDGAFLCICNGSKWLKMDGTTACP